MTAQELIEILSDLDPNTEVFVKHNAGDYWNTSLASEVTDGYFENIMYSSYHEQYKITEYEDEDEDENEDMEKNKDVFVLTIYQVY